MTRFQCLLAVPLSCMALLLTGALGQPSYRPAADFVADSAPSSASSLLDQVCQLWSPARVAWLRMTVLQKMSDSACEYEAEGQCWIGPGNRLRLEMASRTPRHASRLVVVSDGKTLVRATPAHGGQPRSSQIRLEGAEDARGVLAEHGFAGVSTLLENVRRGMHEPRCESGQCHGRPVIRVSGAWSPNDQLPRELRAPVRPRQCVLYLDRQTLWPLRLEWWGARHAETHLVPLLHMEFRDAVVNEPLSAEECARVFTFRPEFDAVSEKTLRASAIAVK